MEIPPAAVASGTFRGLNAALKAQSRLPVVAFGRISPPQLAEDMLAANEADLIGLARQLIADPDTPNKLLDNQEELVRGCIACNDSCIYQVGQEKQIRCVHNPAAGREREWTETGLSPNHQSKRIVVVGGGLAGMKVAEIARRRGHHVVLLERGNTLGGQILLAARQPNHAPVRFVSAYLEAAIRRLGVEIHLGREATVDMVSSFEPEIVVIAKGSEPNLPGGVGREDDAGSIARRAGLQIALRIPGLDLPNVLSSDQVLSGAVRPSGRVLVVDGNGHWEAAGTAEFLADLGCQGEVISASPLMGSDLEGGTRTLFFRRSAAKAIRLRPNTQLLEVTRRGARVADTFNTAAVNSWDNYMLLPRTESWIEDFDHIVPVMGRRSREELFHKLRGSPKLAGVQIERVGDCVAPRLIESTVTEPHRFAAAL
jgi:hypothetical protein